MSEPAKPSGNASKSAECRSASAEDLSTLQLLMDMYLAGDSRAFAFILAMVRDWEANPRKPMFQKFVGYLYGVMLIDLRMARDVASDPVDCDELGRLVARVESIKAMLERGEREIAWVN